MTADLTKMEDWFCTVSGRRMFVSDPDPAEICIEDVAHGLSHACRFGGHVVEFYSVAQHSVLVSHHVDPAFAKAALLHDAAEAYIGDIIHPLKQCLPDYKRIENLWEAAVAARFDLSSHEANPVMWKMIKLADLEALVTERRDVCHRSWRRYPWKADEAGVTSWPETIWPLSPISARMQFLARWKELLEAPR